MQTFAIDIHDKFWDDFMPSRVMDHRKVVMGNDIIIKSRTIRIRYGFSQYVDGQVDRTHTTRHPKGWTRTALRSVIRSDYRKLDAENRLWGHYPADLYIEGVRYNPKTKIVSLTIGS